MKAILLVSQVAQWLSKVSKHASSLEHPTFCRNRIKCHYSMFRSTPISREAEERGFVQISGIDDKDSLLELARSLGNPIRTSSGEFMRELRVVPSAIARPNTLSAMFGVGGFPLHTDTAFWALPARFLVMRVIGDNRRPTTLFPFGDLLSLAGVRMTNAIRTSVWRLKSTTGWVYCEMAFRTPNGGHGFRYDRQCMTPANSAARKVDEYICSQLPETAINRIVWSETTAMVVANWQSLHGRGPEPPQEQQRILQRIYVG
jgi:hypothetical protein